MDEPVLHMVQLDVDARRLMTFSSRNLPLQQDDLGFSGHQILASLFGEGTVQPFRISGRSRRLRILGYAEPPGAQLEEHARRFANPLAHAAVEWASFATKEMPRNWQAGAVLGFEVRACPVVRLSSPRTLRRHDGEQELPSGTEIDAYQHFLFVDEGGTSSRERVYAEWLRQRLAVGARLIRISLTAFRRLRLVRRSHDAVRRSTVIERPEAILGGTLEVVDAAGFLHLLRRGVGRHRAYGFGMLLVRPAEREVAQG